MSVRVKDCAYCGSEATMAPFKTGMQWRIHCTNCPAEMVGWREEEPRFHYLDTHDALLRDWNRRAHEKQ